MDQFDWDRVCEIVDAKTNRDERWRFAFGDYQLRIKPTLGGGTTVGFSNAKLKIHPARFEVIAPLIRQTFGPAEPIRPGPEERLDLLLRLARPMKSFRDCLEHYDNAIAFLALLGATNHCAFGEQLDENLGSFHPDYTLDANASKGRLNSDIVPGFVAEFATKRQRRHLHCLDSRFELPSSGPRFTFESTRFPLRYFDKVKVDDPRCDRAFYFHPTDDVEFLKTLFPPLSALSMQVGRFHFICEDGALRVKAANCQALSMVPALAAAAEIWRALLARATGLLYTPQASPVFCSIPHQTPDRSDVPTVDFQQQRPRRG